MIIAKEQERLYTADDLYRLPDDGKRYELVKGKLIEMSPINLEHGYLTVELITLLNNYAKAYKTGRASNEVGYRLESDPDTVRAPDVAFVVKARLVPQTTGFQIVVPDLAIEVISPGNTVKEMTEKIAEYFAVGVQRVWVVNPTAYTIQIYHSPKQIMVLDVNDTLEDATLLPGFSVPVRDIFAVLTENTLPDSTQS